MTVILVRREDRGHHMALEAEPGMRQLHTKERQLADPGSKDIPLEHLDISMALPTL